MIYYIFGIIVGCICCGAIMNIYNISDIRFWLLWMPTAVMLSIITIGAADKYKK